MPSEYGSNSVDTSKSRLVFVPPLPLNAIKKSTFVMLVQRRSIEFIKILIDYAKEQKMPIECYIRHESTVKLLNEVLGLDLKPSNALYEYRDGDILVMVGLKKPVRGAEVTDVKLEDLDIALAFIS